jgi:hypothetical protein
MIKKSPKAVKFTVETSPDGFFMGKPVGHRFTLYANGEEVISCRGFMTAEYMNRAVEIHKRNYMGLPPLMGDTRYMEESTIVALLDYRRRAYPALKHERENA